MSVLQNPVRVMKTLIAQTAMVLSAVLVNKDSLEMAQHVKVSEDIVKNDPTTAAHATLPKVQHLVHN